MYIPLVFESNPEEKGLLIPDFNPIMIVTTSTVLPGENKLGNYPKFQRPSDE